MLGLQQFDHDHYVSVKWETTQQYSNKLQQKNSVKRPTPRLLSVNPTEGKEGTMITMVLQDIPVQPVKLAFNSLVVDTKQLHSQQQTEKTITTTLMTTIPSFQTTLSTTHIVPISVCFFDSSDIIEDTSFVANFTYQFDDIKTESITENQQPHQNERKRSYPYLADDYHSSTPSKRSCQENVPTQPSYDPSIISSFNSIPYSCYLQQRPGNQNDIQSTSSPPLLMQQQSQSCYSPPSQQRKSHRRPSLQNLKSTSHQPSTPVANYQPYPGLVNQNNFELVDDLDTMMQNWTVTERMQGRRLVRFWREDGPDNLIQCGCQPIAQIDSAATDINNTVVSCIYWPEKDEYYITSVDAIYLLESLMKIHFGVEEKNRIRRNLEGFRPVTVGKCKPISAEFFKRVMGFPHPKPRNIEKDIKAFTWKILPYALKKIITKYAIATTSPTITTHNNAPGHYTSSLASTSQQQLPYRDNDTLSLPPNSSMFLPPTSFSASSISPDSMTTSSSSLSPLLTPPSATDNDHSSTHRHYQRSHDPNNQQLYYNPTTMTYGCHQEPGVRPAQEHKLQSDSSSSSNPTTILVPSPPLSSAASPSPPILPSSEANGMTSTFISAPPPPPSYSSPPPPTTGQHHQHPLYSYSITPLGTTNAFHDAVTSIPLATSLALPSSSTPPSSKYVSQLFANDGSSLV